MLIIGIRCFREEGAVWQLKARRKKTGRLGFRRVEGSEVGVGHKSRSGLELDIKPKWLSWLEEGSRGVDQSIQVKSCLQS